MARVKLTNLKVAKTPVPSPKRKQKELWDTEVPGFGLRIGHGGRRTFMVMVRVNGVQRRYTIATYPEMSLKDAREEARKLRADARQGIDPKEREAEKRRAAQRQRQNTFAVIARDFIEDHAKKSAPRSWGEMNRKINKDLLPQWGDRPIRSITRQDVKELIRKKARKAPVSANRLLSLVKSIFYWAIDEEVLDASPAVRIKPEKETERDRVLNDNEIGAVWSAFDQLGYPFGPLFKLLLVTGQRRGEVAAMRWLEIEGNEWRLPGSRAKSGSGHLIPLSPLALQILEDLPRVGKHVFSSDRASEKSNGKETDKPVNGFAKAKRRCDKGGQVTGWHLHDLRRTVATNMRELGVDRLTVSKVLNHAESGITKVYDRYAAEPEKRRALERWARRLEAIVQPESAGKVVNLR